MHTDSILNSNIFKWPKQFHATVHITAQYGTNAQNA